MTDVQKGEGRVIELIVDQGRVTINLQGDAKDVCGEIMLGLRKTLHAFSQQCGADCAESARLALIDFLDAEGD